MLLGKLIDSALEILVLLGINEITFDKYKVVETGDGAVLGLKQITWLKEVDYYSFRGIPYAEAPIGDLRFKAPKPVKSWAPKIINATDYGNICYQFGTLLNDTNGQSEDCLYLNIFVPANIKSTEKLPVMFYTFGGANMEGSGNDFMLGPDFFIEKRVIVVTFNYRVGVFGYLSLNTPEYSGNMALKDQQLALKWIYRNIANFNGDQKKISIIGHSSGAVSTHFQVLSAESRKYFQNAIILSGTGLIYSGLSEKQNHLDTAFQLAKNFGKPTKQLDKLIAILKSEKAENFTKYLPPNDLDRLMQLYLGPVIERPDAVQPIITESVEQIYEKGGIDVDTIFSVTTAEALSFTDQPVIGDIDGLNKNFTLNLPFRNLNLTSDSKEYQSMVSKVREFYFGNDTINVNKSKEYVNLLSDINFCYGIDKTVKLHASKSKAKTFYIQLSVDSKLNVVKRAPAKFDVTGAGHADDLGYLFLVTFAKSFYNDVIDTPDDEQSKISIQTIDRMTELYTKFPNFENLKCAKCSNFEFKPVRNGEINFLDITNDGFVPGLSPNSAAMQFWSDIEKKLSKYIGTDEKNSSLNC